MRISEVSEMVLEPLIPFMEKHGFKLNKRDGMFSRRLAEAKQIFDFFFYKKSDHISIKPEIRIKIKPIEKVYQSATVIKGRPYLTLGNHLFEIVRYLDEGSENEKSNIYNWLVEDEEDVQKLVAVIPEYFEESILPYFERNSSIARVDVLLNKSPRDMTVHNWSYPLRANIGIIAAKLNNNPSYDELLQIYDEETQEAEETYRLEFLKLREILNSSNF